MPDLQPVTLPSSILGSRIATAALQRIANDSQLALGALQGPQNIPPIGIVPAPFDPVASRPPVSSATRGVLDAPLSRDDFQTGAGAATPVGASAGSNPSDVPPLSDQDVETFREAHGLVKAAKAGMAGTDKAAALAARRRLLSLVGYLAGFLDSRNLIRADPPKVGLTTLFGAPPPMTIEEAADKLDLAIADLTADPTRSVRRVVGEAIKAVGDVCIALGVGIAILG